MSVLKMLIPPLFSADTVKGEETRVLLTGRATDEFVSRRDDACRSRKEVVRGSLLFPRVLGAR